MKIPSVTITKQPQGLIELAGELDSASFEAYRPKAIEYIAAQIEIPGFRKGKAPIDMVEKNVTPDAILQEMAEYAIAEIYPAIMKENKIDAIGQPQVMITKLAAGNPLGFKITTAVIPEVTLPDYKKIAKEENKNKSAVEPVTDEEMEKAIERVRHMKHHKENDKEGEEVSHDHDAPMPELDDAFVQTLGDFKNVADFIEKMRKNMNEDKEKDHHEKHRIAIVEKIIAETSADVPEILISAEQDKMLHTMTTDIERMGMKFDDYLTHIKKTKDDLRKEWETDARKRVMLQLAIQKIAENEKLEPTQEEIDTEVKKLSEMYASADPMRLQAYAAMMLANEKVFAFLESR